MNDVMLKTGKISGSDNMQEMTLENVDVGKDATGVDMVSSINHHKGHSMQSVLTNDDSDKCDHPCCAHI